MKTSSQDRRRGAVLVQFAVLVAALLGIAALASDLGLIRATQASMQNAADAGAIEGLRWTDAIDDNPRRQFAKDAIRRTYDLDAKVHVEGGTDEYFTEASGLGAGPVVQVLAANGIHGAGGLVPSSVGQYKPNPQPNSANLQHGDLVAGEFDPNDTLALQSSDYSRTDFTPVPASASQGARSFLARLRRTHDPLGLDGVSGVSDNGGGVPILFGLGPLTLPNTGAAYDVRRHGVTVRASAIAQALPALQVGPRTHRGEMTEAADDVAPFGYLVIGRQNVIEKFPQLGGPGYETGLVTPVLSVDWWFARVESGTLDDPIVVYAFEDGFVRTTNDPTIVDDPIVGWVLRVSDRDVVPPTIPSAHYTTVENDRTTVLEVGRVLRVDPYPAWYQLVNDVPLTPQQHAALAPSQRMRFQVDEPLVAPDDTPPLSAGEFADEDLVFVAIAAPTDPALGFESPKRILGFVTFECVAVPVVTPRFTPPSGQPASAFVPAHVRLELRVRGGYVFPSHASAISRRGRAALASGTSLDFAADEVIETIVRDQIDPTVDVDDDGLLDFDVAFKYIARHGPLAPVLVR